jgi:hypothetical protein
MKLGTLRLGVYRLIIVISFWCISPFIFMECPSLSHLINVSLKSTLSEISIATPDASDSFTQERKDWGVKVSVHQPIESLFKNSQWT